MTDVVVTGIAVASPFGSDLDALWRGVCHGPTPVRTWRSPVFEIIRSPAVPLPAGAYADSEDDHRGTRIACDLIERALADAGFTTPPEDAGLALGCLYGESDSADHPDRPRPPMLATVADRTGLFGPVVNTPSGCATGNLSVTWAADRIRRGDASCMVAGGVDAITSVVLGLFMLFGNIADELARPFAPERDGFLMGEGGAMFVLESAEQARARGAPAWMRIVGWGTGHDAAHPTRPHPEARGLQTAIRTALREADLQPSDIAYVNAHSPGTEANDPGESAAYRAVFGAGKVPVSSTKAALGHAQGGANALELACCGLALRHGAIPPTLNVQAADPSFGLDVVVGEPRPLRGEYVLSSGMGMGGGSAVVVVGRGEGAI